MGFLCKRSQQDNKVLLALFLQTELQSGEITDSSSVLLVLSLRFSGDDKYIYETWY